MVSTVVCVVRARERKKAREREKAREKVRERERGRIDILPFMLSFIFLQGGPYHDVLHSVLGAYTCYRPDVGYVRVHTHTHTHRRRESP